MVKRILILIIGMLENISFHIDIPDLMVKELVIKKGCDDMDKQRTFDDVPVGESISYEHFLFYLKQGREIEFVYHGKEYFISHTSEGRVLWMGREVVSEHFGSDDQDILDHVKIDGIILAELIKGKEIKITTVF